MANKSHVNGPAFCWKENIFFCLSPKHLDGTFCCKKIRDIYLSLGNQHTFYVILYKIHILIIAKAVIYNRYAINCLCFLLRWFLQAFWLSVFTFTTLNSTLNEIYCLNSKALNSLQVDLLLESFSVLLLWTILPRTWIQ